MHSLHCELEDLLFDLIIQTVCVLWVQCVQGSKAWFVPDSPAEGWTGEHVLRLTGHGPLYILSNYDNPQVRAPGAKPWLLFAMNLTDSQGILMKTKNKFPTVCKGL